MRDSTRLANLVNHIIALEDEIEEIQEGWESNEEEWKALCDPARIEEKCIELSDAWSPLKEIVKEI